MKKFLIAWLTLFLLMSGCTVAIPSAANAATGGSQSVPTETFASPAGLASLHVTGRLVYLAGLQQTGTNSIALQILDLASGSIQTIFQADSPAYLYAASVSPDGKQVVLSYTPTGDFPGLYLLPMDGSASPRLLFLSLSKYDQYIEPIWSPDGKYIYFVHTSFDPAAQKPNQPFPVNEIQRLAYPSGTPENIAVNAYWPRLSMDGSELVYVSQSPRNNQDFLSMADPDGSHPTQIRLNGPYVPTIFDAPLLLPDGKTIVFSAPTPHPSSAKNWLEWVMGIQSASAHNIPSEWWSVPVTGGTITQLTQIQATGLYASISPDGKFLASFSGNGIFLLRPDGSYLTLAVGDLGGIAGTVDWIP